MILRSSGNPAHVSTTHTSYSYTTSSSAESIGSVGIDKDRFDSPERFGTRLRDLLLMCEESNNSNFVGEESIQNRDCFLRSSAAATTTPIHNDSPEDDLLAAGWWNHAEDVFRHSLKELRVLRARDEQDRDANEHADGGPNIDPDNGNDYNRKERMQIIRDCLRLLDNLSDSLPRAEEYSSSWLVGGYNSNSDDANATPSSVGSFLTTDLLNEFLKEWMMGWKVQQQSLPACATTKVMLPSPSQMAERVDKYRSRCLVQPNPTSFNLLLNAMIGDTNSNNGRNLTDRRKAVRLADNFLGRLLKAQHRHTTLSSSASLSSSARYSYVDVVSVTTVMKGWVDLGQPQKAHQWLDSEIPLNAVAYSTLIHGWARRGEALEAESILERALEEATSDLANRTNHIDINDDWQERNIHIVDRVVFHTVLDAWAARAASQGTSSTSKVGQENKKHQPKVAVPALRAKALVQTMIDMADHHPLSFGHLRPNDETWHKLIAVVATTTSSKRNDKSRKTVEDEVGPRAAEKLLLEFESKQQQELLHSSSSSLSPPSSSCSTPAVLLNRILNAYCSCGTQMEAAEAFYHRRCKLFENESPRQQHSTATIFPNEVTFDTILNGWANAAKVAAKKKKNTTAAAAAAEIPLRAQAWLEAMQEQHGGGGGATRSYSSVLQAWSMSTYLYKDAADRAEDLLRRSVWTLLPDDEEDSHHHLSGVSSSHSPLRTSDLELAKGTVICTNIVLRAWSNQIATDAASGNDHNNNTDRSNRAVGKCLRLLNDFLDLVEKTGQKQGHPPSQNKMSSSNIISIEPTEETFRAVLHAIIATPSNGMNLVQKHDRANALLRCMKDTYRLYPSKGDLSKLQRLTKRRDAFLERRQRRKGSSSSR
jgi:hypothetical protein